MLSQPAPATSSAPGATGRYKWLVVFMLWLVCFFNYADRQAIFAVFPKLQEEFHFTKVQLGLIGSAFMWVYAFGAPFAGLVSDRVRRKHLILGGCLFWSFVTVMTGWCSRLWHFVTVRALEGFGETFYFPASMSLLSDYHGPKTRSRAMSFHQSSVYIGTIGGSWLGAWFAEYHGWRYAFYFFGLSGIILALLLYRTLREPRRGQSEEPPGANLSVPELQPLPWKQAIPAVLRQPVALLLMGAFMGANFVATIFLTWTPTFLFEKFKFSLTTAGLSGTVFIHLASAVSVPFGGWLADRLAARLAPGRMITQASGLILGSVFVALVGSTSQVSTLVWSMILFGLCKGLYDANIFASLYDVVDVRTRGTAAGLMNFVGWGGGALGPLAVGWASTYGRHADPVQNMSEAIAFGGVVYLLAAALLIIAGITLLRRARRRASHEPHS